MDEVNLFSWMDLPFENPISQSFFKEARGFFSGDLRIVRYRKNLWGKARGEGRSEGLQK